MKTVINRGICAAILVVAGCSGLVFASESDPWTYAHIPLVDSAGQVSDQLANTIETVIDAVNFKHSGKDRRLEDTAIEFAFFAEFRSRHIRDVAWGLFERCIGTNSCPDWPRIDRIQMYPEEGVYHASNWRFIPADFHLASIIELCNVRMGADKLTHFFDDGFHFYNALRSKWENLEIEDIRKMSMAFERSYMGTRLTGIVSRADIEANLAGVQFYTEFFGGSRPMIGRKSDGSLVKLRNPDVCDYVNDQFDERILPNEYVYGLLDTTRARELSHKLMTIIDERSRLSDTLAQELSRDELNRRAETLLARRIPLTRWQNEFPKLRMAEHAIGWLTHIVIDSEFRRAARLFGINPLTPRNLGDRKPVNIQSVDKGLSLTIPVSNLLENINQDGSGKGILTSTE